MIKKHLIYLWFDFLTFDSSHSVGVTFQTMNLCFAPHIPNLNKAIQKMITKFEFMCLFTRATESLPALTSTSKVGCSERDEQDCK